MAKVKSIDENIRSRNWCLLLYPDDPTHEDAVNKLSKGYRFVGILHDKCKDDEGEQKKPHYHLVLRFPHPRWKTAVADELGIASNYLDPCRSLNGAYCYLVHDGLPDAYQYPHSLMFGPLYNEAVKSLEHEKDQNQKILTILRMIDQSGKLDERKLLIMACEAGLVGDVLRLGGLMSRLIDIHNMDVSEGKVWTYDDHSLPF